MSQFIEMFSDAPKVGINNLVDTVWGSSPDSKTYNDKGEGVPFYQGKTEFGDLYINAPVIYCTAPIKMAKANAILMSVRAPVGAVNIATQDCCIGRGLASITPKEGKSTTMFVYYALKYMEEDIDRLGTGSTFKAINKDSYAKIQMPDAKISEQIKFVSLAEQADKSEFVGCKSQFIEMFGNPLSSIQKNELKKLGDCCQINPRRPSVSISDSDLVSFVPMPAVNEDGYIDGATNEEYGKVKKGFTYFENNDVLFAKITPCMENGKGAIAEALTNGIGMGSTEFHVLRPIEGISNPYWLLTLTRMPIFRECAAKNMSGTGGQRRVGAAFLENFMIGLPSISEQETFETIYRQADKSEYYN